MSARTRRDKKKSLKRKTETKAVRATFRIYVEGATTEPEYISALSRLPELAERTAVQILIEETGAVPSTLVDSACEDKRRNDLDIDQYWCVFDVESPDPHPNLKGAMIKARDNGVATAVSNPCFELWLVLHHETQTAFLETDQAISMRNAMDQSEGKHLIAADYMNRRTEAVRRARSLEKRHRHNGTAFPDDNPSSTVCKLLEALKVSGPQE